MMAGSRKKRQEWSCWYLLSLIQFIAVLWPPFYNRAEPALIGMPFFTALYTLIFNITLVIVLTPLFNALSTRRILDTTVSSDYHV
jgi:Protein of unknown function (DUF3311)